MNFYIRKNKKNNKIFANINLSQKYILVPFFI